MLEQRELTGERLADEILALAGDADGAADERGGAALARPDAARVIVDRVLELARDDDLRPRLVHGWVLP